MPAPTLETVSECRRLCESNVCGAYGRTWGCPPGSAEPEECIERVSGYSSAMLISRTYPLDPRDRESTESASREFQDECRKVALSLRKRGMDVLVMADGGCGYCEECAYPEECRHPDMLVPSISGFGILMKDYVESCGRRLASSDGGVELFGIVLFR